MNGESPKVATVLVVDDEPVVRSVVSAYLARDGFETIEAATSDAARELIEARVPHLVVLDVMLPGTSGFELCRWIRCREDLPVIMLTARVAESDRIIGFELGADDYVTKPFSPRELVARVRAVLRRTQSDRSATTQIVIGDLRIDGDARRVTRGERERDLTAKEFDLLWFLAKHPGIVFSREALMERVWGYHAAVDTGTVTVHIRKLREKIELDPSRPSHVQTVWGVGYRFLA